MSFAKFGISSLNSKNSNSSKENQLPKLNDSLIVRVDDIVLNEQHPSYTGPNSIGTIYGYVVKTTGDVTTIKINATPSDLSNSSFPLVNEYVKIWRTLNPNSNSPKYVYDNPIPLYGVTAPNSNIFPSTTSNIKKDTDNLSYTQVGLGATNIATTEHSPVADTPVTNPSQNTFVAKSNIHPLRPFMGDKIYEGRFGNSIRFGSTAKVPDVHYGNSWSTSGENGDPITILRNGQDPKSSNTGYEFVTEDINTDLSSIWLTSYQKIKLPSTLLSEYNQPQIILNSDRVVINSKNDSVILNSKKNVLILSQKTIVESTDVTITSNNIRLGAEDATESVLKGDTTNELLKALTQAVQDLANVLQFEKTWPGGVLVASPNPLVQGTVLPNLVNILNTLNNDTLKSQTTKVK